MSRFSEALYIIKPHAFAWREDIRARLEIAGVRVVSHRVATLSQHAIRALYPDIQGRLLYLSIRDLSAGRCEIGILRKRGVIGDIVATTGPGTNPLDCGNVTIRRRFGRRALTRIGPVRYFYNAIHCSRDQKEFDADLRMSRSLKHLPKERMGERGNEKGIIGDCLGDFQ